MNERAINVLDAAVLVLSAVEGIKSQTEVIWKAIKLKGVPVIFFINKMDRADANFKVVVEELKNKFNIDTVGIEDISINQDKIAKRNLSILEIAEQVSYVDRHWQNIF